MGKLLTSLGALALVGLGTAWVLTEPDPLPASSLDGLIGDPERGALVFAAGGCASCHAAPEADDQTASHLGGGRRFETQFGTFIAPNISSDPVHGIGNWSDLEIVNAVMRGVSPEGAHYYPAFPYSSYIRADVADIVDLAAYLRTLPAVTTPSLDHEVGFPFNIRRSLGGWKLLFLNEDWIVETELDAQEIRGRELVEGLAHCGECHTPRNILGGSKTSAWLGGAANPSGDGTIPNITSGKLDWSAEDIAIYLESGFTPSFDTAGGEMVHVVRNMAKLPQSDRNAIAAYLKAVPPVTQ
ncbi:cytochrome c [Marivivens sp. LCG002]|uniref:cytochrome c n=1 Tax=Marivivens sp. LCG002 TaxID=3051171 RepID=UPI00255254B0|nr:cytochrome c [Marivivens sp. LCG002]WIV52137.1 cytochrome c [Marivivens sp. LCG002]